MGTAMERWEQVAFKQAGGETGWEALGENGWFTMLAWAAGPNNVRKSVQSDAGRTVRCARVADGVETTWLEPFTPEDRAGVEDDVNSYIGEAGIPPRPPGFVWHLRVPAGWAGEDSVADAIGRRITSESHTRVLPLELWPFFERITAEFYAENGA